MFLERKEKREGEIMKTQHQTDSAERHKKQEVMIYSTW